MSEEGKTGVSMGDLKKLIQDTVADVVKGVTTTPKPDDPKPVEETGSIQDRVKAEIEKIRAGEKAEAEKASLQKDIADLKQATAEKPPVERRRVHRFMGWGE